MTSALYLAAALALITAVAHSALSERILLRPLRAEAAGAGVFSEAAPRRLVTAMFHLPSLCWAAMAASMLLLDPTSSGARATLQIYAGLYTISGVGNFWALGRPHIGGVLLLSTAALTLAAITI